MADELHVHVFQFSGRAELEALEPAQHAPMQPPSEAPTKTTFVESFNKRFPSRSTPEEPVVKKTIAQLNVTSDALAAQIEEEVRKVLPPYLTVQAEVRFGRGSLLVSATVILLSWVGAAIAAGKEEVEKQLGELVRIAVQRVFSRVIHGVAGLPMLVGPLDITVQGSPQTRPKNGIAPLLGLGGVLGSDRAYRLLVLIATGVLIILALTLIYGFGHFLEIRIRH